MPMGFSPVEVGRDYVLGTRTDSLDVVRVEFYPLRKRGLRTGATPVE